MKVEPINADWRILIQLHMGDLRSLDQSETLTASWGKKWSVEVQKGNESKTRIERQGDNFGVLFVPQSVIDAMLEGDCQEIKTANGALPLSVRLVTEPGVGALKWIDSPASLDW